MPATEQRHTLMSALAELHALADGGDRDSLAGLRDRPAG